MERNDWQNKVLFIVNIYIPYIPHHIPYIQRNINTKLEVQ